MLINAINRALDQIEVVRVAGHILQIVHKLAHHQTVKYCAKKKSIELRTLFQQQCQKVRREFDSFHRKPPLRINEPNFAGGALWAKALSDVIEEGWVVVLQATEPDTKYNDGLELVVDDLKSALHAYQQQMYKKWLETMSKPDPSLFQELLDQVNVL